MLPKVYPPPIVTNHPHSDRISGVKVTVNFFQKFFCQSNFFRTFFKKVVQKQFLWVSSCNHGLVMILRHFLYHHLHFSHLLSAFSEEKTKNSSTRWPFERSHFQNFFEANMQGLTFQTLPSLNLTFSSKKKSLTKKFLKKIYSHF